MKNWISTLFCAGVLTVNAHAADSLLQEAQAMRQTLDQLENSESAIAAAFDLVKRFDRSKNGPLFMTQKTLNGMPRAPKVGLELEYAMFDIQQALIDSAYTPENLEEFRSTFDGATFGTSVYFPGKVEPPKSSRQSYSVQINASQPEDWGAPVAGRDDPARRPTGCYLAPGCIAEVIVPKALVGKGYSVRVGAHSWDLSKKPQIKRLDRVSLVYPIEEETTLIANPLGGGIYMEVPYLADAGVVEVELKNVVRSPFYSAKSFDQTSAADWEKERMLDAPWADFETDKFMMQVPSEWIRDLDDPATLMQDWDKAMDGISELFGRPTERSKHVLYLQVDVIMRGQANFPGYPQSNYAYNPNNPKQRKHQWLLTGPQDSDWSVLHEVGHAQFFSKFRGEVEADVNMVHCAVMNRKFGWSLDKAFGNSIGNMKHLTLDEVAIMWMVTENFRQGKEMNHSNVPGDEFKYQHRGYGKYVEIANLFGWEALSNFWHEDSVNWKEGDKVPQNNDPVDDRILRLSKAAGADLRPLIHFWGIQPENPTELAKAIKRARLKPSDKIKERLEYYKTMIPMDNDAFRAHSKRVYPGGLNNPQNPKFGTGWYLANLTTYGAAQGEAAQKALQDILDLYF
jgi:hypothetical protein